MFESMKPILKAAGVAAFVTGLVLMALHPPELDGAEGLVGLIAGAAALIFLTAWGTAVLLDHDSTMTERDFERLVQRAEELARQPPPPPGAEMDEFGQLVADAIDRLPPEFQAQLDRVPVIVSRRGEEVRAYGRYYGDTIARSNYEDRIVLYQDTLERDFGHNPELLAAQVDRTLKHELAHHLGWNEPGVRGLGL